METKKCTQCGEVKSLDQFHKRAAASDGLQSRCKECNKKNVKEWQKDNPTYFLTQKARSARIGIQRRAREFGVSFEEMEQLLLATHCEICGTDFDGESKHVDHDHVTGKIRGVLCGRCNRGLGHFLDDPALLRKATAYLEG